MPEVFPTQHILMIVCITSIAYLLLHVAYSMFKKHNAYIDITEEDRTSWFFVFWLLASALLIRIMLSVQIVGNAVDIGCFTSWGNSIAENGYRGFYTASGLADYPPGYLYVLGWMASIARSSGHFVYAAAGKYDAVFVALIKLPTIIADLASALFVFLLARRKYRFAPSFLLMALIALSPILAYISGGWGQVDQFMTIFIALAIFALVNGHPLIAGTLYGVSILVKPQALMLGPILAVAYLMYIIDPEFVTGAKGIKDADQSGKKASSIGEWFKSKYKMICGFFRNLIQKNRSNDPEDGKKPFPDFTSDRAIRVYETIVAVMIACLMIFLTALPFADESMSVWDVLMQKYLGTATSYKYATVNAYNVFGFFGKNWVKTDEVSKLGLTYGTLGTIGMVFSVTAGIVLYLFGRKKTRGALFLASGFTLMSIFMLGHYMHERYMIPCLLLMMIAYIYYSDRRLLGLFYAFSVTGLLNCLCAFIYCEKAYRVIYPPWDNNVIHWCSFANIVLFAFLCWVCVDLMIVGKKRKDVFTEGGEKDNLKLAGSIDATAKISDEPAVPNPAKNHQAGAKRKSKR